MNRSIKQSPSAAYPPTMTSKVDYILSHRDVLDKNNNKVREYKVVWKDNSNQAFWEPKSKLTNDRDAIQIYLRRNPEAVEDKNNSD